MTLTEAASENQHPRLAFDEAVQYSIKLAKLYMQQLRRCSANLNGLRYLEIGPGADFAPQLVLASEGVQVTLADKYLAEWDAKYHPGFYRAFLQQWNRPAPAVEAVLASRDHAAVLRLVREPAEKMRSIKSKSMDFVLSNAVLEHVENIHRAVVEFARVTVPGGVHAHQVDFRDHRNFDQPLDYLLMDGGTYARWRIDTNCVSGTAMRMPEMIDTFARYFWLWDLESNIHAEMDYVQNICDGLPADSPYKYWPAEMLRPVSGRLWLTRKGKTDLRRSRQWHGLATMSARGRGFAGKKVRALARKVKNIWF